MTRHVFILMALVIIAIATWAYNVNYNTMTALDRVSELRAKITKEREAMQVLRVEWAYLNAPDRLAALVSQHNTHLKLVPMAPEHLKHVAAVPYVTRNPEEVYIEPIPVRLGFPIPVPRPVGWVPND